MACLDGAFAKLGRAYQHLSELDVALDTDTWLEMGQFEMRPKRQVLNWVNADPGEIVSLGISVQETRQTSDGRWQVAMPVEQTVELRFGQLTMPPLQEWGVLVGDISHNLRSALDNMVWALSSDWQKEQGQRVPEPPLARDDPWRRVAFPICTREGQWKSRLKSDLWAVHPSLLSEIECVQPWKTGKEARRPAERELLNVLHELWNGDKHRSPSFVAIDAGLVRLKLNTPSAIQGHRPTFRITMTSDPLARVPLEPGAKIADVRVVCENPNLAFRDLDLPVDIRVIVQVAFDDSPPAYGAPVRPLLREMCDVVAGLLARVNAKLR